MFDTSGLRGTQPAPVCGNGVREPGETCDGADLGNAACTDLGFSGGTLSCAQACGAYDTSGCTDEEPAVCGDGVREGAEECDGEDLGGRSCEDFGFPGGILSCGSGCRLDTSACGGSCGDGILQEPEACDGAELDGMTCMDFGFYAGDLACTSDCRDFDTSGCSGFCGDGILQGTHEACDGPDIGGASCADLGCRGAGTPGCAANCLDFDRAGCFAGHDEDGDNVDDNCDNCPTWNGSLADADGDGVGDSCESTLFDFSEIAVFDAFVSAPAGFSAYGGTWTPNTDVVNGTAPGSGIGANYLQATPLTAPFAVETVFTYPANGSANANYAGVTVGARVSSGSLVSFYACVYERDAKKVQIWKYDNGYTRAAESGAIATNAANGDWRRVRAVVAPNAQGLFTLTCEYFDARDKSGSAAYTPALSDGSNPFLGLAGLRLYNEDATFRAYVRYE